MASVQLTYLPDILKRDKSLVPDLDKMCLTRDFVNTKRFSPVRFNPREEMPDKDSPEYESWWIEQYRRCVMGYIVPNATKRGHDVWIPGRFYFYLNFWYIFAKLDDSNRKEKRPPKFISIDYFKYMCLEMMFTEEKDLMFPKARQKGFSEYGGSNVAYNFLFLPSSVSVIVAGQGDYAEKTMDNVLRGLKELDATEFYKRRAPNRADYIKAEYKEELIDEETGDKRIITKGFGSEVYCITALNNTQALSRLSPFFVLYEEIGKWKKGTLKETSEFVKPSLEAEGVKTGYQVYIGTGGDLDESVADVEEMAYQPKSFGLLEFNNIWEDDGYVGSDKVAAFVPAYEFKIIDDDGNSLIQESIDFIKKDWESKNRTERYRAVTQNPIYLSQMFMMTSGGFLGEEALMRLNDRKRRILVEKELQIVFRAKLDWIDPADWDKGVTMTPDEEGEFHIQQVPEKDQYGNVWVNLYSAATDSYDKPESESSFSQGSCTIFKEYKDSNTTGKHWVARLTERPTEIEGGNYKFYEDTIKLCMYYGECFNLIEYSNILIFEYYKRKHMQFLLKERPTMTISSHVQDPKANNQYGIEPSFIPHALNMWRDFIKQDDYAVIEKMNDLFMIERFANFKRDKNYNCDITISCALNVTNSIEDSDIGVYSSKSDEEESFDYGALEMKNGNLEWI